MSWQSALQAWAKRFWSEFLSVYGVESFVGLLKNILSLSVTVISCDHAGISVVALRTFYVCRLFIEHVTKRSQTFVISACNPHSGIATPQMRADVVDLCIRICLGKVCVSLQALAVRHWWWIRIVLCVQPSDRTRLCVLQSRSKDRSRRNSKGLIPDCADFSLIGLLLDFRTTFS